jgi:hypothetical protein
MERTEQSGGGLLAMSDNLLWTRQSVRANSAAGVIGKDDEEDATADRSAAKSWQ